MRPLIVVEGSSAALADALAEVRSSGWTVVRGWWIPSGHEQVVCTGSVSSPEDAASALLAAVAGAGVVIDGRAPRDALDRLCDDLRHLGSLDHRTPSTSRPPRLTGEERALVERLLEGMTLGDAARSLNISRRTADRRIASVREKLGVATTAEALVGARRRAVAPSARARLR
jgi:DNA-binding NarL/FixJ family response regulator